MAKRLDLLQGTLDMLILKAVSLDRMHGYGILLRIQQISGERLQIQQGSLYPALYRLEHQGLMTSEWGESENKRKQNTTGSPPQAAGSFTTNSKIGGGWPTSLRAS
jgi:PadR family transcriptional regulator PadR